MAGHAPLNPELLLASLATYELVSWFLRQEEADRRYLLPEQAAAIARHGDNYLKHIQNLSRLASANLLLRWKVLPKHHEPRMIVFKHVNEDMVKTEQSARSYHAFVDEDCVLQWKKLATNMSSHALEEKLLLRYLLRLGAVER
ncbi:unnamed protein product [Symbiodinium sp. CCMP2592]|nr:unnamed protein product [Symbiodinium sp. CCMP2592]